MFMYYQGLKDETMDDKFMYKDDKYITPAVEIIGLCSFE